jgi:hypothetical protein
VIWSSLMMIHSSKIFSDNTLFDSVQREWAERSLMIHFANWT